MITPRMSMTCPGCGHEVKATENRCSHCGTDVQADLLLKKEWLIRNGQK